MALMAASRSPVFAASRPLRLGTLEFDYVALLLQEYWKDRKPRASAFRPECCPNPRAPLP